MTRALLIAVLLAPAGREPAQPYADPIADALKVSAGGLSADDVARRAAVDAPTLRAYEARLDAAAAGVDRSTLRFVPQVSVTGQYARLSPVNVGFGDGGAIAGASTAGPLLGAPCPPELGLPDGSFCVVDSSGTPAFAADFAIQAPLNQFSLQAQLGVPFSDYLLRILPGKRGSDAQAHAAEHNLAAERLKVQNDARIAYYNWLRSLAQVAVAEQSLVRTKARLEDAKAAFDVGLANKADVMRLEAALASTESGIVSAKEFRDLAARQLALIMGEDQLQGAAYTVGEDVLGAPPPGVDGSLDDLIREAQRNREEVRALDDTLTGTDEGLRATRASYYPRLDGFAEVTYANPNQRFFPPEAVWRATASVGLSLTWVLNDTLDTKPRVQELKANQRELRANRDLLMRGVAAEVSAAWADRKRARAAITLNRRAMEASEEGYRVAVDLFRVGNATTTDILDAEAERVNASLQDVNARIDLRVAEAKLRYATGRETWLPPETAE